MNEVERLQDDINEWRRTSIGQDARICELSNALGSVVFLASTLDELGPGGQLVVEHAREVLDGGRSSTAEHVASNHEMTGSIPAVRSKLQPYSDGSRVRELSAAATAALLFRLGDRRSRSDVFAALLNEACHIQEHEGWPDRINGKRYLARLVDLAILEEHRSLALTISGHWADLAGVDAETWVRDLSRKYEVIRGVLDAWCVEAMSHVRRRGEG